MELRYLCLRDKEAFHKAYLDFERSNPGWEFGFDYDKTMSFEKYLVEIEKKRLGFDLEAGRVPASFLVAVIDGEIVGRVSIRHELNEHLNVDGGNVGYGVVEAWRKKGIASKILSQSLDYCRALGLKRVMLTCEDDNIGSYKVIERNLGVLVEKYSYEGRLKRRYWIEL